jgi:thymidylate kinase
VICDRYLWDTWIDFRLNFPQERIDGWLIWRVLRKVTPQPDITFLLLIPVSESQHRSQLKEEPFPSSAKDLTQRLQVYEVLAKAGQWQVLDGQRPVADLVDEVWASVQAKQAATMRHDL